ncbi:MAG: Do family serine endopeptidase [Candidatus Paracaedimonas acanthamoebae]|uniref:Do family serine endopeptidase n=1 Tax=Candidatus Paracaedimonas acanthamoebae TaxID=244581 RepID=A0A8J7PK53_9PROT|nr:Do family serine endopeptidase [Candidatus Paracaedimonas acanthamoebae]
MKKNIFFVIGFLRASFSLMADPLEMLPCSQEQIQLTFAPIVKKIAPAVVSISAARVVKERHSPFFEDPIFRHFFGEAVPVPAPHARVQSSLGSGVLVKADGLVITNDHVIKQAEEIKVILADGREYHAQVVARDVRTDLAALKLKTDEKNLPYLELKDADTLQVGDLVLAVGNPFGFGQTVTSGIVSGLARNSVGIKDFRSLIQTDAAINPGNSGGPMITLDGKVVGINTAIFSNTGGSIGIGFAIPSNLVVPVIASVDRGGKITRLWLGVALKTISSEIALKKNMVVSKGVSISQIYPNTPAEKAGLKEGDIIVEINGHEIVNEAAYRFRLAIAKQNEASSIVIIRGTERMSFNIIPEIPPDNPNNKPQALYGRHPLSGLIVVSLTPAVATELGLGFEAQGGVVVLQVEPGTPASLSGLLPGDVILELNGKASISADQLARNLGRSRQGWQITFKRGTEVFVQNW